MARKKKEESGPKRLSPGQYWEWRCTLEELKSAKLNEKRVHLEREIMNKEIENRKLKLAMFKEILGTARKSVEAAELENEKFRERLEADLGIDLKDCVIDEVTYEVTSVNDGLMPKIDED